MRRLSACMTAACLALPIQGAAQGTAFPVYEDTIPIASLNRERLVNESAFGRALINQLTDRQTALVAENERLQEALEREELELTERRKEMEPEAFAPLAQDFDTRVKDIRRRQEDKALQLTKDMEQARFAFFRRIEGVIIEVMQLRGAVVLLDDTAVLLSTEQADITAEVLTRLDAMYSAGELTLDE